jgi:hypothetical protein
MATNVKILLRRGLRTDLRAADLLVGELGYTTDTKQLYVGTGPKDDEIIFDPFVNAHAIVQTFLNQHTAEPSLEIDEDLIIRDVSDVPALLTAMQTYGIITAGSFDLAKEYKIETLGTTTQAEWNTTAGTSGVTYIVGDTFTAATVGAGTGTAIDIVDHFYANLFASERKNVEVLTENSFSQVYANMHLQTHTSADGRRPDLFKKELLINDASTPLTIGTFLKYAAADCTSFFIDYSLKQVGTVGSGPAITFVRVGTLQIINGVPHGITEAKLTDTNTEIHRDVNFDSTLDFDDLSNIVFTAVIDGTDMKVNYTQDVGFTTEISYTVKRWSM